MVITLHKAESRAKRKHQAINPFKFTLLVGLSALAFASCGKKLSGTENSVTPKQSTTARPKGMVWIPVGTYWRGNEDDPGNLSVFLEGITNKALRNRLLTNTT